MEFGIDPNLPLYAGGLGILAGDHLKSATDLGIPMIGVGLLYSNGYFKQKLVGGKQDEIYENFDPTGKLELVRDVNGQPLKVDIPIEGNNVKAKAWKYEVIGRGGFKNSLYLLDANGNEENLDWQQKITGSLYRSDHEWFKIVQRAFLGIGGVRLIEKLGIEPDTYHLNEGHGAFACWELSRQYGIEGARERTIFTTHTQVEDGHDRFDYENVYKVLGGYLPSDPSEIFKYAGQDNLNMTRLALNSEVVT